MANIYIDPVGGNDSTGDGSISTPYKTLKDGATAARTAPGDEIRIKRTIVESLGVTVDFTKHSNTATLSAALTKVIDRCESAWTVTANVTESSRTGGTPDGSYYRRFAIASGFTTGLVAYKALGSTQDYSSYQKVTFYIFVNAAVAAGVLQICLCSDTAGATPVDSLTINSDLGSNYYHYMTLDKGSALGSSIQSIAVYALSDPGTVQVEVDAFHAANSLHFNTAIGLNDGRWTQVDGISEDGLTLHSGNVYWEGDSVTDGSLYGCQAVSFGSTDQTLQESGSNADSGLIKYRFGWDFVGDTQDGMTFLYRYHSGMGRAINWSSKQYIEVQNMGTLRFSRPWVEGNYASNLYRKINNLIAVGVAEGLEPGYYSLEYHYAGSFFISCAYATPSYAFGPDSFTGRGSLFSTATIEIWSSGSAAGYAIMNLTTFSECWFFGKITFRGRSGQTMDVITPARTYTYISEMAVYFASTVIIYTPTQGGHLEIGKLTVNGAMSYLLGHLNNGGWSGGHISQLILNDSITLATNFVLTGAFTSLGKGFSIDRINADGRFASYNPYCGVASDHITGGESAGWAYGGSGVSLYLNPLRTIAPYYLAFPMYVFAPDAADYKLVMQLKKTSSAANCKLYVSISGAISTPVVLEELTLTDTWTETKTAQFTTTNAGFLIVVLHALDGSTTGNIGIDAISLEEQE